MLFNSYIFIFLFLPVCLMLYFACNNKGWYKAGLSVLIIMSFWFYAYNHVQYLALLVFSIVCNWCISRILLNRENGVRKFILLVGIGINVLLIFYFKYMNFFIFNVNRLFHSSIQAEQILLPLGISFYTFQQISYLVDSYRGETKDYCFLEYAAFVSFFPQLVAGPIVLHDEIIPQFRMQDKKRFCHEHLAKGLYIFSVGLFKKVILADTFGNAVTWGYSNWGVLSSMELIIVMVSYTFQIYFDFSGYSEMAIGIASMFQIDLPLNFDSPYQACSIIEFWNRWHLTLTRFLRKYIYFPLGGSRRGKIRTYINIMVVFLVSGIWHGASWTFILWGLVHGLANVLNRIFQKTWDKCNVVFRWLCTFTFINFTWVIFRAESVGQAYESIKRIIRLDNFSISRELMWCFDLQEFDYFKFMSPFVNSVAGFWMWFFLGMGIFFCLNLQSVAKASFKPTAGRLAVAVVILFWSVVSLSGISTFLYFNF